MLKFAKFYGQLHIRSFTVGYLQQF